MRTLTIKDVILGQGIPKICIPLVGKNIDVLKEEAKMLMGFNPDIVEWRVDYFEQVEDLEKVEEALAEIRAALKDKPLLFTFRNLEEGGQKSIPAEYYLALNKASSITGKVDLIDIELGKDEDTVRKLIAEAHDAGVKVVLSYHDCHATPAKEEMITKLRKMQTLGGDISKIAVMAQSEEDVLSLLWVTNAMTESYADRPFITISMGEKGVMGRMCAGLFGSSVTFAAVKETSAPGQINVTDLRNILLLLHNQ